MKAYRFRLASVLRVRAAQEQAARSSLSSVEQELALAASRRRNAEELAAAGYSLDDSAVTAEVHLAQRASMAAAAAAVRLYQLREAAALESVGAARADLKEAAHRVAVLERLEDRARTEHRAAARAAEDREADDLSTSRFRDESAGEPWGGDGA